MVSVMSRIEILRREVADLYNAKHTDRADWADWMLEGHVIPVANASREVAARFGGDPELAEAAGLLHDIADAVMKRENPMHEAKSLEMARMFLEKVGFTNGEIEIVVDDAIAKHSCHGEVRPSTKEGKALAAGDAVVHIKSDFYDYAESRIKEFLAAEQISAWVLPKLDRDFTKKISYDSLREEVRPGYELLKERFK